MGWIAASNVSLSAGLHCPPEQYSHAAPTTLLVVDLIGLFLSDAPCTHFNEVDENK